MNVNVRVKASLAAQSVTKEMEHLSVELAGAMRDVLADIVNVARMKLTVKIWMLTAGKKTVQKSVVIMESVSVDSVFVGRGIIQMKFILANSASVIISTVIDPTA